MTRKDFVLIAAAIKRAGLAAATPAVRIGNADAAHMLAAALASDNPAFDRARFLTACGVSA